MIFNDGIGSTVIRYRYCERSVTKTFPDNGTCNPRYNSEVLDIYDEAPTCSEFYTKMVPEGRNFRAFLAPRHGSFDYDDAPAACRGNASDEEKQTLCASFSGFDQAVLAYSKDGTICFRGQGSGDGREPVSCTTDPYCLSFHKDFTVGYCNGSSCRTVCQSKDGPGKSFDFVLSRLDDGRSRWWVEIELDPIQSDDGGGGVGGEVVHSGGNEGGANNSALTPKNSAAALNGESWVAMAAGYAVSFSFFMLI